MPRTPARVLVASALSLGSLLTGTACSTGGPEGSSAAPRPPTAVQSPDLPPSPAAAPALTEAQAQASLITETDLGEPWTPTEGAATWRDGLLKATVGTRTPDCRRLLDALYTEELFGTVTGARAVTALDNAWDGAQLHYQVVTQRPADVDDTLAWLETLPQKCGRFTATDAGGAVRRGQVTEAGLPDLGDACQALRLTLTAETSDGELATLTLDVAAVRVGDDAITLTHGGLGEVSADVTRAVAGLGTQRLTEVRKQGRAPA